MVRIVTALCVLLVVYFSEVGATEQNKKSRLMTHTSAAAQKSTKTVTKQITDSISLLQKALASQTSDLSLYTKLAQLYVRTGNFSQAFKIYHKILELDTSALEVYEALGNLKKAEKNMDQALVYYRQYVEKGGKSAVILPLVLASFVQTKEYDNIIQILTQIPPDELTIFQQRLLAEAFYKTKEYSSAIEICKAAISKKALPRDKNDFFKIAGLSGYYLQDTTKALNNLTLYLKTEANSKDADVLYVWAALQEKKKPFVAIKLYEANLKRAPHDYRNYLRLALLLSKSPQNKARVLSLMKTVISLSDTVASAWLEIAKVYRSQNNQAAELNAYKKYKQLVPDNSLADIRISALLLEQKDIDGAMNALQSVKDSARNSVEFIKIMSDIYLKKHMAQEAIALLEPVQSLDTSASSQITANLITAYLQAGIHDKAEVKIKAALDKSRTPALLLAYSQILFNTGKYADAENSIMEYLAMSDPTVQALTLLASIQRANKRFEEAIKTYAEMQNLDPQNVVSYYERAEVYTAMQKTLWAEKFYSRVLAIDSTHALSYLGLAKCALLRNDKAKYAEFLERAKTLDPNNVAIQQELSQQLK